MEIVENVNCRAQQRIKINRNEHRISYPQLVLCPRNCRVSQRMTKLNTKIMNWNSSAKRKPNGTKIKSNTVRAHQPIAQSKFNQSRRPQSIDMKFYNDNRTEPFFVWVRGWWCLAARRPFLVQQRRPTDDNNKKNKEIISSMRRSLASM